MHTQTHRKREKERERERERHRRTRVARGGVGTSVILAALISAAVGDTELMHGIAGGVESLPHIINAYFSANKNHCVLKVDCKNAFNSVSRAHILQST
jgi:hypothetical protein